jgi:hypothetical protein
VAVASEEALMARLRALVETDAAAALEVARQAERSHPDGPLADERSYLTMRALVELGDIPGAREEAYLFYERHPGSPYAGQVQRLTGLHPVPGPPGKR